MSKAERRKRSMRLFLARCIWLPRNCVFHDAAILLQEVSHGHIFETRYTRWNLTISNEFICRKCDLCHFRRRTFYQRDTCKRSRLVSLLLIFILNFNLCAFCRLGRFLVRKASPILLSDSTKWARCANTQTPLSHIDPMVLDNCASHRWGSDIDLVSNMQSA